MRLRWVAARLVGINWESPQALAFHQSPDKHVYSKGTIKSATILMILIKGLIAGPAVSL